jgi:hypothetical protein
MPDNATKYRVLIKGITSISNQFSIKTQEEL